MSAHTPGPWSLDPPRGGGSFDVRASSSITVPYGDGSIPAIAKVWDYALGLKQGVRGSIAEGSVEANARLIAAAPDLLAACADMLAAASGDPKSCGHDYVCACPFNAARGAIAKAVGK